jgi:hypothetical protein
MVRNATASWARVSMDRSAAPATILSATFSALPNFLALSRIRTTRTFRKLLHDCLLSWQETEAYRSRNGWSRKYHIVDSTVVVRYKKLDARQSSYSRWLMRVAVCGFYYQLRPISITHIFVAARRSWAKARSLDNGPMSD